MNFVTYYILDVHKQQTGGHYVPMTTYTILQNNDAGKTPYIHLKGFLLGNPSTDHYENQYGFVGGIYGHGMLKSSDWYTWYVVFAQKWIYFILALNLYAMSLII